MKNRTWDRRSLSEWWSDFWEQFWCCHDWEVDEMVGPNWDISVGIKIRCKCKNCGKMCRRPNFKVEEVPDEKIDEGIRYRSW